MARVDSISRFSSRLADALGTADFHLADQCVERLKVLLFEAAIDSDSAAVAQIEAVLSEAGENFELRNRLRLEDGPHALAWRLRADAGTATLATRIRPPKPAWDTMEDGADLRKRILKVLRDANRAMPNNGIAERVGRDAPSVSRCLKSLSARGLIRQWKVGKNQLNAITDKGRGIALDPVDCLAVGRELISRTGGVQRGVAITEVRSIGSLRLANVGGEKLSALTGEPVGPQLPAGPHGAEDSEHRNEGRPEERLTYVC